MDRNAQQQAERVDQEMSLAAGNLLARVVALQINRGPLFAPLWRFGFR
jgi:hypothetical protein